MLTSVSVAKHGERLVGVGGDHDLVEAERLAALRCDGHVVIVAMDRADRR